MVETRYNGYFVNKEGEVFGNRSGTLKKLVGFTNTKSGYRYVSIARDNDIQLSKTCHRLVAETLLDNPNMLPQVNHINGIKTDNRVENLEWCTASSNIQHAYSTGLKKVHANIETARKNSIQVKSLFTIEEASDLIEMKEALNLSSRSIAKFLNCGKSAIERVVNGTTKNFKIYEEGEN